MTAVAYVDPGNVATNVSAGAGYGYRLLWVVVGSNAAAGLIQYLSAKLGACSGRSLTEHVAGALGPRGRLAYWLQAELMAAATDIAEVVGGALALRMLFGLPLWLGAVLTAVGSTGLLLLRDVRGQRAFALAVTVVLVLVGGAFVGCALAARPAAGATAAGLVPSLPSGAMLLASGIFGATVMPHAVYVHSALSRDGLAVPPGQRRAPVRALLSATRAGVVVAMTGAGTVNAALLLIAAALLPAQGGVMDLVQAHTMISALLGAGPALALALALLLSGLASTSVGTHAGDLAMRELLHRRVPLWLRRLPGPVPALVLLAAGADPTRLLVLSQVALSVCVPFVLVPLVAFTARGTVLGAAVNHRVTTVLASLVAAAAMAVDIVLLTQAVSG
uniref:Nramp family divalent metal transporter n=1 Tax=Streptomyces sp. TR1341 TaxID=2601266 RepID=UPI0030846111